MPSTSIRHAIEIPKFNFLLIRVSSTYRHCIMSVSTAQCFPIMHSSKAELGLCIIRISTVTANSAVYASCWSFTTPSVQDRHKIIQASLTTRGTPPSFNILFLQWAVLLQIKRSSSLWFWRVYSTVVDPNLLVLVRLLTNSGQEYSPLCLASLCGSSFTKDAVE